MVVTPGGRAECDLLLLMKNSALLVNSDDDNELELGVDRQRPESTTTAGAQQ